MKLQYLAAAAAVTLGIAGCSGPAAEEATSEGESGDTLTVALPSTSCILNYSIYSGLEEGFFEEEGLNLKVESVNGSAGVLQAILSGQADFGGPGATPVINAQASGEDMVYFLNASPGGSFFLVTPGDSGVESASDLEGKTIGVATADGNEVGFVDAIMESSGIDEGEFEKLTVGEGGQAVAAFERGEIDAYAASSDGLATLTTADLNPRDITPDTVDYLFGNGYAAPRELIESQPEQLQAFGKAFNKATQWGKDNPDAAIENCAEYQPQELEDQEYAELLIDLAVQSRTSPYEGDAWGSMRPEDWEMIMRDAVAAGNVEEGQVDVETVYTNDLVEGFQL